MARFMGLSCNFSISNTRVLVRQVWYIVRLHIYKLISLRMSARVLPPSA